ncbi:hypothetical protein [Sphingomonas sp. NFR15]|uniref:hypothetical protein n=1 Tax=Sphingomonas sp. NFR15 TaxID=1566282 RepID=UPI00115FEB6A|nr:hypothetical protein [Sphingomonas sp. NFR15]
MFHDGTSMIVAKAGMIKEVPDALINDFVIDGSIEKPKGWKHPDGLDDDDDDESETNGAFSMAHQGFGKYAITGPGLDQPEIVQGKEAAEKRVADLAAAASADAPPAA